MDPCTTCSNQIPKESEAALCSECKQIYHATCVGYSLENWSKEGSRKATWKCPKCKPPTRPKEQSETSQLQKAQSALYSDMKVLSNRMNTLEKKFDEVIDLIKIEQAKGFEAFQSDFKKIKDLYGTMNEKVTSLGQQLAQSSLQTSESVHQPGQTRATLDIAGNYFGNIPRFLEDKLRSASKNNQEAIISFHAEDQTKWSESLPFIQTALNSAVVSSTDFTPAKLFLGREILTPIHLRWMDEDVLPTTDLNSQETWATAYQNLLKAHLGINKMSLHIPAAISTCHAEDRETPPDSFQETRDLRGGYCDETVTSQHNRTRSTTRPSIWATCHCLPREKVGRIFEGFWDCPCPGQCAPRAGRESCVGRRRSAMANMMASIFNAVRRKCDELSPNRENVILIVSYCRWNSRSGDVKVKQLMQSSYGQQRQKMFNILLKFESRITPFRFSI
ncbi:unnamed protein product [Nesidiocoris tenuis]|uniref:PHD-type domain-containing protein n=1 Tax=Nesidiocoris tenuis TaxID=355587 RepID=A0A6H5GLV9_9HEMI|nr:unnamed protein product [Nesidiocoris tenuis]